MAAGIPVGAISAMPISTRRNCRTSVPRRLDGGPVVDQERQHVRSLLEQPSVLPIAASGRRASSTSGAERALDAWRARRPRASTSKGSQTRVPGPYWGSRTLHRSADMRMAFDPPEKALMQKRQNWLLRELFPLIKAPGVICGSSRLLRPRRSGDARAGAARGKGREGGGADEFASRPTDVRAVHGGYVKYRKGLLDGGVELYGAQGAAGDFFDRTVMSLLRDAKREPPHQGLRRRRACAAMLLHEFRSAFRVAQHRDGHRLLRTRRSPPSFSRSSTRKRRRSRSYRLCLRTAGPRGGTGRTASCGCCGASRTQASSAAYRRRDPLSAVGVPSFETRRNFTSRLPALCECL